MRAFAVEKILDIRCQNINYREFCRRHMSNTLTRSELHKVMTKGDKRPRDHQNPDSLNRDAKDLTNIINWSVEVI